MWLQPSVCHAVVGGGEDAFGHESLSAQINEPAFQTENRLYNQSVSKLICYTSKASMTAISSAVHPDCQEFVAVVEELLKRRQSEASLSSSFC